MHHIYANDGDAEGLKSGKYPDGSAFVYDLLEIKESDGITKESTRRRIDLMTRMAKEARTPVAGCSAGSWAKTGARMS